MYLPATNCVTLGVAEHADKKIKGSGKSVPSLCIQSSRTVLVYVLHTQCDVLTTLT